MDYPFSSRELTASWGLDTIFVSTWEFKDFVKALQSSQEKSVLIQNVMDFMLNKMVKEEGAGEWKRS